MEGKGALEDERYRQQFLSKPDVTNDCEGRR